ncbi:hypothetical protein QR680_006839 [Steinernema hermaphroditum]|uniref:Uncharacterized protein n=1 Tax=Steinernema hermaphroditum TaxID=289476 RepID=A0AA39LY21_9BILA|nr:hypothetical protein QR680_006839 [Steinernema hermaphroditum]
MATTTLWTTVLGWIYRFYRNGTKQDCEFAEVNCRKLFPPLSIYSNLHARVIPKEEIVLKNKDHKKRPNVILFVLDSVSEANWRRSLPKTLKVLLEDYKSTVFKGFNKVGDNSFPNAVAFLTGKRVMAPGHQSELPDDMSKSFFDDWPLIWNDYSKHNYATFYAEDLIKYNLFYYLSNGFRGKPVDHYFRPYWVRIYETFLYRRSTPMCFGNKPSHMVQLEYLKSIIMAYKSKAPIFALHWLTELGHDWSNQVGLGDDDIASFFKNQKENLKNSYVFVFSDHGHRFDSIRQTMNGRIEERLPFFSVHVPESEIERNKELKGILQRNAKKLTSFWDLHATLLDILSEAPPYNAHNGHSLFKDLPEDRNCQSAHIPEEECVCQREIHINVSDPNVSKAAACLIAHINNLLPQNCSQLKVANIKQAQMVLPSKTIALGIPSASFFTRPGPVYVNYRVTLEASPSEAIFEGVVKNALKEDNFEVVGDISRINKYGNQSSCVNSPTLKKFCFCHAKLTFHDGALEFYYDMQLTVWL